MYESEGCQPSHVHLAIKALDLRLKAGKHVGAALEHLVVTQYRSLRDRIGLKEIPHSRSFAQHSTQGLHSAHRLRHFRLITASERRD
jgi:hypothetical protein